MKIMKTVLSVILAILIFISVACSIVLQQINHFIGDYQALYGRIFDAKYNYYVYNKVYTSLGDHMSLIVIRPDDISDILTRDEIEENASYALKSVLTAAFTGETSDWSYENEDLHAEITALLYDYAEKENIEYEEGSDDSVYEMICETITGNLKVLADKYTTRLYAYVHKIESISSLWYYFVILYAVCVLCILLLERKTLKNAFYNIALPSYLGAFSVFVVAAIMYSKDYLSNTVLSDLSLQHFVQQIYNTALYDVRTASLVVTVSFVVLSVAAIVIISLPKRNLVKLIKKEMPGGSSETDEGITLEDTNNKT